VVAFVDGITAAAVGAIAGSVVVTAERTIVDLRTAAIALATILMLWRYKQLQEPVVVAAAALRGLALYPVLHAWPKRCALTTALALLRRRPTACCRSSCGTSR